MSAAPRRFPPELLAEIKARTSLAEVIGAHVNLRRAGRELEGLCPFHNERTPSFTVNEAKAFYHCFGCGAHGDAVCFLMQAGGRSFPEAVEELAARAGIALPGAPGRPAVVPTRAPAPVIARPTVDQLKAEDAADIAWCRDTWHGARKLVDGDPVDRYLAGRGITRRPLPPTLRFAPDLEYRRNDARSARLAAMIGAVQNLAGEIVGLHCTYLRADGSGKAGAAQGVDRAKKMRGTCWGGAVRFARAAELVAIGEGLETCLTVWQARPELAVWAALSLGNIVGRGKPPPGGNPPHPTFPGRRAEAIEPDPAGPGIRLPGVVRRVLILADADGKDRFNGDRLLQRGATRFQREGREVRIAMPPDGHDFNSLLMRA